MILQDPQTSLNPVFTIGEQLREAIFRRTHGATRDVMHEAVAALRHVDIAAPEQRIGQYPHQMSGGMKQRVVGAIAMSGHPEMLIADEPTTALDVTIQLQYLKLLKRLQRESGMAILFITHDFGVVARMCDRVAVMYAGRIVECGPVRRVFEHPSHPYTQALIASVPKMTGTAGRLATIEGQPPSLMDLPAGCRFAPRCPYRRSAMPGRLSGQFRVGEEHTADCWRLARMTGEPLLRVEHLRKYYPFTRGMLFARTIGEVKAVDDISFTIDRGQDARPGGQIRLRQDDDIEADPQSRAADRRAGAAGRAADPRLPASLRDYRALVQAVFQDPWSSLNPRMTAGRIIAESLIVAGWRPREDRSARQRTSGARRAAARTGDAVSARVQRRAAPAHRAGGCAGLAAAADRARRTGLGAGRLDPRADDEPAEGHPGAGQCRLPAGRARSRHGALHGRRHGGHVSRQDRRTRADASAVRRCPASLHEGAVVRGAAAARRPGERTRSC